MQAKLEKEWDTLMGPKLASYSKILSLRKKILRIQVTSSVLRQELTMSKEQLIQKLNDALGEQIITTIEIF
jgi:predicted nucleic acid-binding Zn ribbon protein